MENGNGIELEFWTGCGTVKLMSVQALWRHLHFTLSCRSVRTYSPRIRGFEAFVAHKLLAKGLRTRHGQLQILKAW